MREQYGKINFKLLFKIQKMLQSFLLFESLVNAILQALEKFLFLFSLFFISDSFDDQYFYWRNLFYFKRKAFNILFFNGSF